MLMSKDNNQGGMLTMLYIGMTGTNTYIDGILKFIGNDF